MSRSPHHVLCQLARPTSPGPVVSAVERHGNISVWHSGLYTLCPHGHVTHVFLSCDVNSHCWSSSFQLPCRAPGQSLPPPFWCITGVEHVPYTLVCDHRQDCSDGSDEDFCVFRQCMENEMSACHSRKVSQSISRKVSQSISRKVSQSIRLMSACHSRKVS